MKTSSNPNHLRGLIALGALFVQVTSLTWQGTAEGQAFLRSADLTWTQPLFVVVLLGTLAVAVPGLFAFFQLAERREH